VLAEKKGASFIILPGKDAQKDSLTLRTIATRENRENIFVEDIIKFIKNSAA
jgi:hypothetical protein